MKNKNLKLLKNNEEIYVLLYMLYKDFLDEAVPEPSIIKQKYIRQI